MMQRVEPIPRKVLLKDVISTRLEMPAVHYVYAGEEEPFYVDRTIIVDLIQTPNENANANVNSNSNMGANVQVISYCPTFQNTRPIYALGKDGVLTIDGLFADKLELEDSFDKFSRLQPLGDKDLVATFLARNNAMRGVVSGQTSDQLNSSLLLKSQNFDSESSKSKKIKIPQSPFRIKGESKTKGEREKEKIKPENLFDDQNFPVRPSSPYR